MTNQILPFGSGPYFVFLVLLLFSRGMDFLSTWVATPNLLLEGNPFAKLMGWRGGLIFNAVFCAGVAVWPLPAIIVSVISLLVAARNFQSAWMMRSMGEAEYAVFIHERMMNANPWLFTWCIGAQSGLTALVGAPLVFFMDENSIAFAIGVGIMGYGFAVLLFSLLSLWRIRRA